MQNLYHEGRGRAERRRLSRLNDKSPHTPKKEPFKMIKIPSETILFTVARSSCTQQIIHNGSVYLKVGKNIRPSRSHRKKNGELADKHRDSVAIDAKSKIVVFINRAKNLRIEGHKLLPDGVFDKALSNFNSAKTRNALKPILENLISAINPHVYETGDVSLKDINRRLKDLLGPLSVN